VVDESAKWSRLHEAALFVLLPLLIGWVVEMIFHPQIWVLFLIGVLPVIALMHIVGLLSSPLSRYKLLVIGVCGVLYVWAGRQASQKQRALEENDRNSEIQNNIHASVYMPPNGDLITSDFTMTNGGKYDITLDFLGCQLNKVVWRDGKHVAGYGAVLGDGAIVGIGTDAAVARQAVNRVIHGGGDVFTTQCLYAIYHHEGGTFPIPSEASTSIVCSDVTLDFHYSLSPQGYRKWLKFSVINNALSYQIAADDPYRDMQKQARFVFFNGDWRQEQLQSGVNYCDEFLKQP
jgi:hypothetical protein